MDLEPWSRRGQGLADDPTGAGLCSWMALIKQEDDTRAQGVRTRARARAAAAAAAAEDDEKAVPLLCFVGCCSARVFVVLCAQLAAHWQWRRRAVSVNIIVVLGSRRKSKTS